MRPGIFIRLTEEDARKRGLLTEAQPSHKAAEPEAAKPKKASKPKSEPEPDEGTVEEDTEDEPSE